MADLVTGGFSLPNVNSANTVKVPMYEEWNFWCRKGSARTRRSPSTT